METFLLVLLAIALAVIVVLLLRLETFKARSAEQATQRALAQLERWRQNDLQAVRTEQTNLARAESAVQFQQWKADYEKTIREDAIKKSAGVTLGKVTEHFVPYLPEFKFDPRTPASLAAPSTSSSSRPHRRQRRFDSLPRDGFAHLCPKRQDFLCN